MLAKLKDPSMVVPYISKTSPNYSNKKKKEINREYLYVKYIVYLQCI
jgi:hypothetical protein